MATKHHGILLPKLSAAVWGHIFVQGRMSVAPRVALARRLVDGLSICWHGIGGNQRTHDCSIRVRRRRTGIEPRSTDRKGAVMYQKPEVKRFGSLRELTQGGGPAGGGDATNVYHRS